MAIEGAPALWSFAIFLLKLGTPGLACSVGAYPVTASLDHHAEKQKWEKEVPPRHGSFRFPPLMLHLWLITMLMRLTTRNPPLSGTLENRVVWEAEVATKGAPPLVQLVPSYSEFQSFGTAPATD